MNDILARMNDKYQFICDNVIYLSKDDKLELLKIIKRHDGLLLKKFSDGTRIILNKLPDEVVKSIYNLIQYKLKA